MASITIEEFFFLMSWVDTLAINGFKGNFKGDH